MARAPMNALVVTAALAVLLLNYSNATTENRTVEQHNEAAKLDSFEFPMLPTAVFTEGMIETSHSSLLNGDLSAQIEGIIQSFVAEAAVQYYAVSVVHDGQTLFTSGLVTSPFLIHNSISDIFTSSAILNRHWALRFSPDDPVEKFLPNFHQLAPHYSPGITLRQLMDDASEGSQQIRQNDVTGHHEDDRDFLVDGAIARAIEKWRSRVPEQRAVRLKMAKSTGAETNPETNLEESLYPAIQLAELSQALARVSAKASILPQLWENFVEEEFLKREDLKMVDTGLDLGERVFSEAGTAFAEASAAFDNKSMESAGQWYSTATDLAKCLANILSRDRGIQWDCSTKELTVRWALEATGSGLGLTWEHEEVDFSGKNEHVVTNGGTVAEFGSFTGLHPRTKLGVSVLLLTSNAKGPGAMANALGSQILKNLIPPLSNIVDSCYPGSFVCQPAPPLFRYFNDHRSNIEHSDTVEVLGGEVNVTSSPSLGLHASLSISVMVSGKPQHRLGQFLMIAAWGSEESPTSTWILMDVSNPPDPKVNWADYISRDILNGLRFQFEHVDEAVIEQVHEPRPGVVRCTRQGEQV